LLMGVSAEKATKVETKSAVPGKLT